MDLLPARPWLALVALAVPATLALAGAALPRRAGAASVAALALAALIAALTPLSRGAALAARDLGVRLDVATCVMLLLVAALGALIVRFSRAYLGSERGYARYQRCLLLLLAAVTALVVANHLLVIAAAWTATSVVLHQLLTFFDERPAAQVAAHKKFLVSRLADVALAASLWLVHRSVGSLELDALAAWVQARPALPWDLEAAAVLLVLAVALRTAQLPFHGWLIQVMEAPTPVSALLHAGVVNLGGFVIIRVAPWLAKVPAAQLLLVGIGLVSCTLTALIMTTRVSVKVTLAWSTCAQMGFMLVQCGLGLWPLALLHLVAHSLYKAHAFLSAGSVVDEWRVKAMTPRRAPASALALALGALAAAGLSFLAIEGASAVLGLPPTPRPAALVLALLLGLSLTPLALPSAPRGARALAAGAGSALAVALLYLGWHAVAEELLPAAHVSSSAAAWGATAGAFVALFAVKTALQLRPRGPLARALHPWLFAGFYLDELFTRLTFRLWPPHLPRPAAPPRPALAAPASLEVQP